jgi:hypothetical protein
MANGITLTEAVQTSVDALTVSPADFALVKLAMVLAQAIDSMTDEVKGRMLAQTTPQLLATLRELRLHVPAPRPPSKWDEMRPGALAARR